MNYYNENDKHAACWLRNLIQAGMLPAGDVDERSIVDVKPGDLKGYTQHHFFAGIGGWSEALRLAGWPTDQPVWTGSAPCQSFSGAGRQKGFDDPRHLWPVWYELIKACRPRVIFGEQVDAAIKHGWLDLVQNELASALYTTGTIVLPACSVGAPHIRKRLWFMAYRDSAGLERRQAVQCTHQLQIGQSGLVISMGNTYRDYWGRKSGGAYEKAQSEECPLGVELSDQTGRVANSYNIGYGNTVQCRSGKKKGAASTDRQNLTVSGQSGGASAAYYLTSGFWANCDWIFCTDGRLRPVEPRALPLADGVPGRMVKIRGYGNAIVPQVAAEVIKAGMAYLKEHKIMT